MEGKKKQKEHWQVTGWHYLAAFIGAIYFVLFFVFFNENAKYNKLTKQQEIELRRQGSNCLDLYDSMQVWKPIVKKARKTK